MPKTMLELKVECITLNQRKNGGNALFAVGVKPDKDKPGNATARKVINFQTDNVDDLAPFKPGQQFTITITQ